MCVRDWNWYFSGYIATASVRNDEVFFCPEAGHPAGWSWDERRPLLFSLALALSVIANAAQSWRLVAGLLQSKPRQLFDGLGSRRRRRFK